MTYETFCNVLGLISTAFLFSASFTATVSTGLISLKTTQTCNNDDTKLTQGIFMSAITANGDYWTTHEIQCSSRPFATKWELIDTSKFGADYNIIVNSIPTEACITDDTWESQCEGMTGLGPTATVVAFVAFGMCLTLLLVKTSTSMIWCIRMLLVFIGVVFMIAITSILIQLMNTEDCNTELTPAGQWVVSGTYIALATWIIELFLCIAILCGNLNFSSNEDNVFLLNTSTWGGL